MPLNKIPGIIKNAKCSKWKITINITAQLSLAGHLVGLILVGRVFRKAFRILGLGERKGRWVMEQDFHGDFQVLVMWFFASFSGVLD